MVNYAKDGEENLFKNPLCDSGPAEMSVYKDLEHSVYAELTDAYAAVSYLCTVTTCMTMCVHV